MNKIKLLVIIILPFLLTGCITYTELNELEVVQTLAIDYQNEEYHLAINIVEKNENETITKYQKSTGKTIEEAVTNIKMKENKKLYIAHLNLLLITPSIIEKKLDETINYFIAQKESRNDFQIALTNDISLLENEDSKNLSKKIKIMESDTGITKSIILEDFLKNLLEENACFLPYLKQEETSKINGIAYIKNNQITYLEQEEVILLNMLQKKLKKASIDKYQILSNNTSIKYKNKIITIEITTVLEDKKDNFENVLNQKINEMFQKYKNKNIDIFEFQRLIDRTNDKENVNYQDLKIKTKVNIKTNEKISTR